MFVIAVLSIVMFTFTQNFDLVDKDYYEKGINYQEKINSTNRTNALPEKIKLTKLNNALLINFPKSFNPKDVVGRIDFYRASNANIDFNFSIALDSNCSQAVPMLNVAKGAWKVIIYWKSNKLNYYHEENIYID